MTPGGETTVLFTDPRLLWAAALWIDNPGYLWIPAARQNRTPAFQNGVQRVHFPVIVYKIYGGEAESALRQRVDAVFVLYTAILFYDRIAV